MRGKSHRQLGKYLAQNHMPNLPRRYVRAFLIGCVEPDCNPTTYLKGSFRQQWLRGHNWNNAQNYIQRLCNRLEGRRKLRLRDFYSLGKLIHYTTDAFTSAHNAHFSEKLQDHRQYEEALQDFFLRYLSRCPDVRADAAKPVMEIIRNYHLDYIHRPISIHTDTRFSIIVCSMVVTRVFAQI